MNKPLELWLPHEEAISYSTLPRVTKLYFQDMGEVVKDTTKVYAMPCKSVTYIRYDLRNSRYDYIFILEGFRDYVFDLLGVEY